MRFITHITFYCTILLLFSVMLNKDNNPLIRMMSYRSFILLVILVIPVAPSAAQEEALQSITTEELRRHLTFLASDSLQGRGFGTPVPGLEITADYLAENAAEAGLKPAGEKYSGEFVILRSQPVSKNIFLSVIAKSGEVVYSTDSVVSINRSQPNQEINGQLVFAGFGWHDESTGYDDFGAVNLQGKVVLISTGEPEDYRDNNEGRWNTLREKIKIERAAERGAQAVILATSPKEKDNETYNRIKSWLNRISYTLKEGDAWNTIPVILVPPQVADALLRGHGSYGKLLSSVARKMEPKSFRVKKVKIAGNVERTVDSVHAENIIGFVEGSHPQLKEECVVYMAHYDHLGMDDRGRIYNGADDNGSGVVTLLEVAEAFAHLPEKPERSVVFLWVSAEEAGLLGSQFYVQQPFFPLEKTVACINLDMVGRVYEPRDSIWQNSPKLVKDTNGIYTLTSSFFPPLENITDSLCKVFGLVPDKSLPGHFFHSSDHHHFHSNGVPILNLATGYHADYHKPTDDVERISFEKMQRIARLTFLAGYEMAGRPDLKPPLMK